MTQNSKFDTLRVQTSNYSQRIRDFQDKISLNTCLTQFFWKSFRKVTKAVPFGNQPPPKTQNRDPRRLNVIFRQNKYFCDFFHIFWDQKNAIQNYDFLNETPY